MDTTFVGKKCKLLKVIRDASGKNHSREETPEIIKIVSTLGREMFLVKFSDSTTTFLFPEEVEILDGNESN